jgi:predicted signal transduction protein with EAL and GGDEF domain
VLVEVAQRLRSALRDDDVVARLGGDEFAVLVHGAGSADDCRELAERVRLALDAPFHSDGHVIDLGASIGMAIVPDHADDFETLFSRADVAMFAAKRDGTGICLYSRELDAGASVRLGLLGALRRTLDSGGLSVEFQPKVSLRHGGLTGVEALVRWRTEDGVMVPPDEFVPLAEQSGMMSRLTSCVLERSLEQCASWTRDGLRVPVAVNVSLRDVLDPMFAVGVAARLVRFGVLAPMLTLEITERVLADDLPRLRTTLGQLSEIGVRLSLDDFGTGWSSLVLLRHLPVSEVKLDRSFVGRVASSGSDAAIVRAVTDLAHELGLDVVGEGVEDRPTWEALAALGCDSAQGWHVAPPMDARTATAWLRSLDAAGTTATAVSGAAT